MLVSVIDMCVHDPVICGVFDANWVEIYWCQLLNNVGCVQQWGKLWS